MKSMFICHQCDYEAYHKHHLKDHVKSKHEGVKNGRIFSIHRAHNVDNQQKSKKQQNQRIRETARPAIELSPTHCFRQEPILARKISKNQKENLFSINNLQNFKLFSYRPQL